VIIRLLDRVNGDTAVQGGGSDADVITAERTDREVTPPVAIPEPPATPAQAIVHVQKAQGVPPAQLELSLRTGANGYQVVSVAGELDIATADQAYSYITEVIDGRPAPVTVDLSGVTFCDASGLGALARLARHARAAGRQFMLISARPSVLKIMRITGLDRAFPELHPPLHAYSALTADPPGQFSAG
jgi:anti-sigma B factor antagonist